MSLLLSMVKLTKNIKLNCYLIALDAIKAFDKVERKRLISERIDNGVDRAIIMYIIFHEGNERQRGTVFKTTNGCKQGGSLLPWLYGK